MISIVLPVYDEQEVLLRLYGRVTRAADEWDDDYEVVVVDDGSSDSTPQLLAALHLLDARWKVITFSRNFGHQAAISAGIHYARGDAVVVLDADLQDPPEDLARFLDKWREGYEVVYAIRRNRKEGLLKRMAYSVFYRMLKHLASIEIPLDSGDFCVMDRKVVDVLRSLPERSRFVRGLRSWSGFRQVGIEYDRDSRQAGRTKYSMPKLFRLAMDGFLCFGNLPLKLSSWLGIGFCGLSVSLFGLVIGWWASDVQVLGMHPRHAVGWTSLCSLILLLAGVQMLVLGILGEYLARVFEEVKGRPQWIIASASGVATDVEPRSADWFADPREDHGEPMSLPGHRPIRRAG